MTTARTHLRSAGRTTHRPKAPSPRETPVSAESFAAPAESFVADPPADDSAGEPFDPSTLDYDPSEHTVEDVKQYVIDNPETASAVLELEANGKDRTTLVEFLIEFE